MRLSLLTLFILLLGLNIQAQKIIDTFKELKEQQDSTFVSVYPQIYSIKTFVSFRNFSLKLKDLDGFGNNIIYKPNTPMRMGFTVSYKDYRVGIAFKLPSFYPERGNSRSFGLFVNAQTNVFSWGYDFYFLQNRGYYLANPELNTPGWTKGSPYPFRSDLKTINAGLATHVVFSKKFSLKAAMVQSEKQLKSAGGIALDIALKYSGIWNDSTIIPSSQKTFYSDIADFRKGGFLTLDIAPGYAYTYVHNDLYFTSLLYLGVGLQTQSYKEGINRVWGFHLRPKVKFQQIIGYTVDDYFANISFVYDNNLVKIESTRYNSGFVSFNISGGIRF